MNTGGLSLRQVSLYHQTHNSYSRHNSFTLANACMFLGTGLTMTTGSCTCSWNMCLGGSSSLTFAPYTDSTTPLQSSSLQKSSWLWTTCTVRTWSTGERMSCGRVMVVMVILHSLNSFIQVMCSQFSHV